MCSLLTKNGFQNLFGLCAESMENQPMITSVSLTGNQEKYLRNGDNFTIGILSVLGNTGEMLITSIFLQ